MYKKILVPLDGSKRAETILPHVEELAQCFDAEIIFLKVVEPVRIVAPIDGYVPDPDTTWQQHKKRIRRSKTYVNSLAGEFREKNISARAIIEDGPVIKKIIEVAFRDNVDLVAMASHGRTGLSQVFYGSVASGILHQIDRPLLLIRADQNQGD